MPTEPPRECGPGLVWMAEGPILWTCGRRTDRVSCMGENHAVKATFTSPWVVARRSPSLQPFLCYFTGFKAHAHTIANLP